MQSLSSPVVVNTIAASIDGTQTDVAVLGFTDYVVVLVTQLASASIGSILQATNHASFDDAEQAVEQLNDESADIAPDIKFVLGSSNATAASSLYQIIATQLSQRRHRQSPSDSRPLILGIGLDLPRECMRPSSTTMEHHGDLSVIYAYKPIVDAIASLVDQCWS